jgi:hypothetical protein
LNLVNEAADEAIAPLQERLAKLEAEHGAELLGSLLTTTAVRDSLKQLDVPEAAEQLDFLEMEVAELAERRSRDELDASVAIERTMLLHRALWRCPKRALQTGRDLARGEPAGITAPRG